MRRIVSVLFIVFFAAVALVSAGFLLLSMNADSAKNAVVEAVRRETGKNMSVSKDFKIHPSFIPVVRMSGVKVFNPDGFSTPVFIEAEYVEAQVSPLSLLTGKVVLNELSVSGVTLNFEKNAKGRKNWDVGQGKTDDDDDGVGIENEEADGEEELTEKIVAKVKGFMKGKKLVVKKISFSNAGFSYVDGKSKKMYQMFASQAKLTRGKRKTSLAVETKIQGKKIVFSGETSAPEALFEDDGSFDFKWTVKGFKTQASLSGNVTGGLKNGTIDAEASLTSERIEKFVMLYGKKIPAFKKADLNAKLTGTMWALAMPEFSLKLGSPETAEVSVSGKAESVYPVFSGNFDVVATANDFGRVLNNGIAVAPFTLTAKAAGGADGFSVSDIAFHSKEADMAGDFSVKTQNGTRFYLKLTSPKADLSKLFFKIDNFAPPQDDEYQQQFVASQERAPLFSKKPFPLDFLRKTSGRAEILFNDLTLGDGARIGTLPVTAQMENGWFRLAPVRFHNNFSLEGEFDAKAPAASARVVLKTNNFPVSSFFSLRGVTGGMVTTNVDLNAVGNSPAQMAETLNGRLLIFAKDLSLSHEAFQKIQAFLPPSDDIRRRDGLKADCLVVNTDVKNGVVFSEKQIALQSDVLNAQASGSVLLPVEKVDLSVETGFKGRDVIKAMSGTLKMSGDIRKPTVSFDAVSKFQRTLNLGVSAFFGGMKGAQEALKPTVPDNACAVALGQR